MEPHQVPLSLGFSRQEPLEWVAISFSNAWKWKVKVKLLSRVQLLATSWTAAYQAPPSMGYSRQEYWSGLPLPSPTRKWFICKRCKFANHVFYIVLLLSRLVVTDSTTPWTATRQASLSFTISGNLLKLMSIELVMPSNHLILCHPLLFLPSIFRSSHICYVGFLILDTPTSFQTLFSWDSGCHSDLPVSCSDVLKLEASSTYISTISAIFSKTTLNGIDCVCFFFWQLHDYRNSGVGLQFSSLSTGFLIIGVSFSLCGIILWSICLSRPMFLWSFQQFHKLLKNHWSIFQ